VTAWTELHSRTRVRWDSGETRRASEEFAPARSRDSRRPPPGQACSSGSSGDRAARRPSGDASIGEQAALDALWWSLRWRRPRAKDNPAQLSLDLIVEVRTRLDDAFRTAYAEMPTQKKTRQEREAMLAGLQTAARLEADLALMASQLVRAMRQEQASLRPEELETMRQELAAALAAMLGA